MSLINVIKNSVNLRRIFGKRELIIIQKQLMGVKLKNSEITRLSRDIRKKFDAIKELMGFSSEFDLKKGAEIKKIINETKVIFREHKLFKNIKKVILFGSSLEGKSNLSSDIDIAVEFNKISKEEAIKFRKEIMGKTDEKVDIQVYNFLEDKIKKEILNKGKIIYEQSN